MDAIISGAIVEPADTDTVFWAIAILVLQEIK
jgi:hypothetical protein